MKGLMVRGRVRVVLWVVAGVGVVAFVVGLMLATSAEEAVWVWELEQTMGLPSDPPMSPTVWRVVAGVSAAASVLALVGVWVIGDG